MNLIHRVGAGLIVVGGLLPIQAQAQWPSGSCGCGSPAPLAPIEAMMGSQMMGPQMMGPQTCGGPMFGPQMRAPRMNRSWVYRSRTRTRMTGPAMFGDASMGIPLGDCSCGSAPMMMPQQSSLMVPQTSLCPQPVATYLEVPRTVMRQEAVQVQVPITTRQQVTVDEGGYQQVWVPRMVTKTIPQTIMQTQVQYRQVPQTVMERVCSPSVAYGATAYPTATPTSVSPIPDDYPAPLNPVPVPMSDSAAVPRAVSPQTSQVQEWQKVRQRQATIEQQKYEYEMQEVPQTEGYRVPQAAGRFSAKR